ncbi:MAG TPA: ferredoxin Fer [Halobacteriales archaeon]|nr:ferredoxin Fer [Halobacteriales archaeon]
MESPFEVLGIDDDADEEAVERAYREKVKETHPDLGGSLRAFLRVRAAYEAIQSGQEGWDGDAGRWDGSDGREGPERGDGREGDPDRRQPEGARVEYLNYDVLADHGWSLDDEDLLEKAAAADLDPADHGRFLVRPGESLLEAAENRGFAWPYACRGGACANCAVAVLGGELSMPVNHILPSEMIDSGIRLSCVGAPTTDEATVVFNVKHLPDLDELRLPPHPFEQAHRGD